MKYRDGILQLPLRFSAHIMEGKLRILVTNPKSEEIISLYPIVLCTCRLYSVLVITLNMGTSRLQIFHVN